MGGVVDDYLVLGHLRLLLEPGALLHHAPASWREDWAIADPDRYAPAGSRLDTTSPV